MACLHAPVGVGALAAPCLLGALWLLALPAAEARAQGSSPRETEHLVALSVRGGAMATDDQRQVLRLDQEGASARLVGALRPLPWLAGELALGALVVGGRDGLGALLDASLGLRAMPRFDRVTPYAAVSVGVGVTGTLVVPVLHGAAGFWLDVAGEWSVGPEVAVTHAVWEDGPRRTSDALFVSAGLAVAFRPRASSPEPPRQRITTVVRTRTRTRVVHAAPPPGVRSDPAELLRLVDRAVPALTTRSITSMVPPMLFEHDRAELSSCGEASLHELLAAVDAAPSDTRFVIEGHADGTGEPDYNRELSERRAAAIRELLLSRGVAADRVEIRAAGEGEPLVDEVDARALSVNRRVVVHLIRTASPDTSPSPAHVSDLAESP